MKNTVYTIKRQVKNTTHFVIYIKCYTQTPSIIMKLIYKKEIKKPNKPYRRLVPFILLLAIAQLIWILLHTSQ
ncbi:hypothetical protein BFR04_00560 [Gaetbulibacter sp. 4G1]|nr:hypothetical protein BFR04_00560 [Gaetbulibacter sp. 4G1]